MRERGDAREDRGSQLVNHISEGRHDGRYPPQEWVTRKSCYRELVSEAWWLLEVVVIVGGLLVCGDGEVCGRQNNLFWDIFETKVWVKQNSGCGQSDVQSRQIATPSTDQAVP